MRGMTRWKTWHIATVTALGSTTLALGGLALHAPPKTKPAVSASVAPSPEVLTMAPTPPPVSYAPGTPTSLPPSPEDTAGMITTADTGDDTAYYATCAEAKRAGAAPLHRGDPGYRAKLDRDGDGTACE